MTTQQRESDGGVPDSTWGHEAAPATFYAKKMRSISDPYPCTAVRVEVQDGGFRLLSVHWSATLVLKEVGERLARGEQALSLIHI